MKNSRHSKENPSGITKVFIMATKMEAGPFIKGLGLAPLINTPVPIFKNQAHALVISGIGKTNAAMAATYSCLKFSPEWICNLGAAGAADPALHLGDIFCVSKIMECDRPRLRSDGFYMHLPRILQNIPDATLSTQDKPVLSPGKRCELSRLVRIVDMEAAAIVQVCNKFALPCYVFKFVSDTAEHIQGDEIAANIQRYGKVFYSYFDKHILPQLSLG